jgi:hypothetical protein
MGIFNFLFAKLSKKNNNEKNIESEKNIYQEIINFNDEKVKDTCGEIIPEVINYEAN